MDNKNVLVFDGWDTNRGAKFKTLFENSQCKVYTKTDLNNTPPTFLLCLIHIGDNYDDRDRKKSADLKLFHKEPLKQLFNAQTTIIWYGGNEGYDKRLIDFELAETNKDKIWKKIYSASDVKLNITDEDIRTLIAYAQAKAQGGTPLKPKCLLPPDYHPFLNSYNVLCLGYLVANAYSVTPSEISSSVKDAFKFLKFDRTRLPELSHGSVENTRNRAWWKIPFKLEGDKIEQKIKHEWADGDDFPSDASKCLKEIYDDSKSTELLPSLNIDGHSFMDMIAQSYVSIADSLRRKP
jgi:hypothetical protein